MKRGRTSFFSSNILSKVEYPDATTGVPSTAASDDTAYTYDVQGEPATFIDQNGTTHSYTYDVLGRKTLDSVTVAEDNPENVDTSVLAQGYSFDTGGRLYQATSYANANGTDPVNQVQYAYNGLGQETSEWQEHAGAVDTDTSAQVQYGYLSIDDGSRLVDMIYPNGRQEDYLYDGAGGIDNAISRVTSIADNYDYTGGDDPAPVETYTYLGLNTIVQRAQGDGESLSYIQQSGDTLASGDGGDRYTGLDRFGRIIDQNWTDGSTSTERFQYGYDPDGNVLYKNNLLASSFSELYHVNSSTSGDDNSAYDPLNRLTNFRRGTLSVSGNNGTTLDTVTTLNTIAGDSSNSWDLDALGNQGGDTNANAKNELFDSTYDHNGNLTEDGSSNTYTYDAWNRMAGASQAGGQTYKYDALSRRIVAGTTDYYDSADGHVIEEYANSCSPGVSVEYVWSLAGPNDLVLQDDSGTSNTDDANLGTATSGLSQRYYVQQDANENVTSLVGPTGAVLQHYIFDPKGAATVIASDYSTTTTTTVGMSHLYQGGWADPATGLYHFGTAGGRDYNTATGTWDEKDGGYWDGMNLYQMDDSNPVNRIDTSGMGALPNRNLNIPQDPTDTMSGDTLAGYAYESAVRAQYWQDVYDGTITDTWFGFAAGSTSAKNLAAWDGHQRDIYASAASQAISVFAMYDRPIKDEGCLDKIANTIGAHRLVTIVPRRFWRVFNKSEQDPVSIGQASNGTEDAGGLTQREYYEPDNPYKIYAVGVRNWSPLQYGFGKNKPGVFATDAEITDSIRNTPMTFKWRFGIYDCQNWATTAFAASGLSQYLVNGDEGNATVVGPYGLTDPSYIVTQPKFDPRD